MREENRILIYHAQILIAIANDVIASVMAENLCKDGLIDSVLSTTKLGENNARYLLDAFEAIMLHVGWEDFQALLLGPERERLEREREHLAAEVEKSDRIGAEILAGVRRQFDDLEAYAKLMMESSVTHAERRGQLLMLVAKINFMRGVALKIDDIPF